MVESCNPHLAARAEWSFSYGRNALRYRGCHPSAGVFCFVVAGWLPLSLKSPI